MQREQFNDFINGLSDTIKEMILKKIRTAFITEVNKQLKSLDSSLPDLNLLLAMPFQKTSHTML